MNMEICMECDEAIDEDCEICPECGLESPVAYLWYRRELEPDIIKARDGDDPVLLANLLFKAWYDAGSMPDYYVMGDVHTELIKVYKEHQMHERLIFQLCYDATDYEGGSPKSANEALDLSKDIGREDLELYCYEQFKQFNWTYYRKAAPEEIENRIKEIESKINAGELVRFNPELDPDMWVDY